MSKMQNLVSGKISDADIAEMVTQVNQMKARLSGLVALSPKDRMTLPKPSAEMVDEMPQLATAARENPQYFYIDAFDPDEMERDLEVARRLKPLHDALKGFSDALSDTILAAESDAYRNSLGGYTLLKLAVKYVPGLRATLERLKKLFDRASRKQDEPEVQQIQEDSGDHGKS